MKFNPPPNWPQLPAGWTPPPGWKPDPSWPEPPYGWQLWIQDNERATSPCRTAAARTRSMPQAQTTQPWHRRTVFIVLLLIFFFPLGLVLLWLRQDWSLQRRGIITAVVGIVVVIAVASPNPPPTTTVVTTAAGKAAASPSDTPVSSQSATPSPVVTISPASLPSPPPKTSAAAPSPVRTRTSIAPVHTTKAPPPVRTTAPKQGCYPLTNSGNCYKPGEYCRTADRGTHGIDANGDSIVCEDKDGWRWELG